MRFQVNRRSAWLLTALLLGASCMVGRAATPEPIAPPGRLVADAGQRSRRRPATGTPPGTAAQLDRRDRGLRAGARAVAQPLRVRPPPPALRVALQARPTLPGPELPQGPAPAPPREGDGPVRRAARSDRDALRRPRLPRAARPPRARQPGGRPPRPGVPRHECTPGDSRAGESAPRRPLRRGVRGSSSPTATRRGPRSLAACEEATRTLEVDPTAVILEFVYGACDALDDYTSYLTPDKLDDLYAMIDGNFVGLGIELKLDGKALRLVGVIRGGPAWEAGRQDRRPDHPRRRASRCVGLSLDESAGKLQGAEGTSVELTVEHRDGEDADLPPGPPARRGRERGPRRDRRAGRRASATSS